MTAPAAPVIRVRVAASVAYVRWQPIDDATDYKLYVGAATDPSGLEADIADDEVGDDGWFQYAFVPDDVVSFIALTALNITAEESDPSNEVRISQHNAKA
jgi:hypothetical protein